MLLPLLRALHAAAGGVGRVVKLPSETNHARALRTHLKGAGVTRAELHASSEDKSRKAITFLRLPLNGHHLARGSGR